MCLANGDLLLGIGGNIFDPSQPEKQIELTKLKNQKQAKSEK